MGISEGEESEQVIENLFEEIMTTNFPNLVKEKDTQIQEAWRVPNKLGPKGPTPRHIIIKIPRLKDKERILKATEEKQVVTYKGAPIRPGVSNLLVSLGHTGRRRIVLGYTLNTQTLMKTDEQKKGFR